MRQLPRTQVLGVLRRAGMADVAEKLASVLPETVDLDRDRELLARHGISHDDLISRMGGSP